MPRLPGTGLARRPLHFIWMCDCSGSMSLDGKIQALNTALREALPHMCQVAEENPNAQVMARALKFSHGADWHVPTPTPLEEFRWADLAADPLRQAAVDIIFMMDTSGSMGGEIEAVKASCVEFADRIIREGANVRLGLVGFDIGGHRGRGESGYTVRKLSRYTIGVWPLASPEHFKQNIRSLTLGLFGGAGCYLARNDTVDIFPHVVGAFDGPRENARVLVIISDEMGTADGVPAIVSALKGGSITAHVLGVSGRSGAHQMIAAQTGGQFWDIFQSKGRQDFGALLGTVAQTIAKEVTKQLADGSTSAGTDLGAALRLLGEQLRTPPMQERALPPVLVLVSDGQPTDDFEAALGELNRVPWAKKAVRVAIAIGGDADLGVLQRFINQPEFRPLRANNPEALVRYIKWVSTAVLKSASQPASQTAGAAPATNVPIPAAPEVGPSSSLDVW